MTLFIPPPNNSQHRRRRGFTLVEMLVVIGVIALLLGILLPAINLAYTYAVRASMQHAIQAIKTALESYKSDHNNYPVIDYNDTNLFAAGGGGANYPGAVVLCWALIAPGNKAQDGAGNLSTSGVDVPGAGFSIVPNGQVYGPYLEADRFKILNDTGMVTNNPGGGSTTEPNWYLADRYGHPFLYFKANKSADIYNSGYPGFVADWTPATGGGNPAPLYNLHDNAGNAANKAPALQWIGETANTNALTRMRLMLGDRNANGTIDPGEAPATMDPYLIWCAGPNEVFGVDVSSNNLPLEASYVPGCDDATSFTR